MKVKQQYFITVFMIILLNMLAAGCEKTTVENTTPVKIENPENISQIQLHFIKHDVTEYPSSKLDNFIKDLENTTPLSLKDAEQINAKEGSVFITLIYEDGTKDRFEFFKNNEKWYMEYNYRFYTNADFWQKYIGISDSGTSDSSVKIQGMPLELVRRYLELTEGLEEMDTKTEFLFSAACQQYNQECTKEETAAKTRESKIEKWKMYQAAASEGITISEDRLKEVMDIYISQVSQAEHFEDEQYFKDYQALLEEFHTNVEEVVYKSKDTFYYRQIQNELWMRRRNEFASGQDKINGVVYQNASEYYNAYMKEKVYTRSLDDNASKEFLKELDEAEKAYMQQ